MTEQHTVPLADYLLSDEIERCIVVEQEDSVRADWWRGTCHADDWYTTGSENTVRDAAAEHIHEEHRACSAPSERTFIGVPVYCDQRPDHDGDHMTDRYTWPKPATAKPFRCPLASCGLILNDARPATDWMLFAQSLGVDITALKNLDYLREHLLTHTALELIIEIARLRKLLEDQRGHLNIVIGPATKVVFNPLPADLDEA